MRRYFPDIRAFTKAAQERGHRAGLSAVAGRPADAGDGVRGAGARCRMRFCSKAWSAARRSRGTASSPPRRRWFIRRPGQGERSDAAGCISQGVRHDRSAGGSGRSCCPQRRITAIKNLPAFTGGLVGYAGYDTIRYYEGEKLPNPPKDDRHCRTCSSGCTASWSSSITSTRRSKWSPTPISTAHADAEAAYRDACRRIDDIVQRLQQPPTQPARRDRSGGAADAEVRQQLHARAVRGRPSRKGQEYIKAGDIFQFVPSQRLRVHSDGRSVRCVSRAADHQPVAVHVLSEEPAAAR